MTIRAAMATMTTTTRARAKASARRGSVVSRRRVARANANAMRGTRRGMMSLGARIIIVVVIGVMTRARANGSIL